MGRLSALQQIGLSLVLLAMMVAMMIASGKEPEHEDPRLRDRECWWRFLLCKWRGQHIVDESKVRRLPGKPSDTVETFNIECDYCGYHGKATRRVAPPKNSRKRSNRRRKKDSR